MGLRSTSDAWGAISRWLHWISAALIIFGLTHGYWMANMLPRPQRLPHYWFHSLVFVYFGLLLLLRIAWRLSEPTPVQPPESAGWEKASAHLGHLALYALVIAVTVTGYMNWSAFPARFDPARAAQMDLWVLGIYKLPAIHDKADAQCSSSGNTVTRNCHGRWPRWSSCTSLAALRHHFLKRNHVMRRMWGGRSA